MSGIISDLETLKDCVAHYKVTSEPGADVTCGSFQVNGRSYSFRFDADAAKTNRHAGFEMCRNLTPLQAIQFGGSATYRKLVDTDHQYDGRSILKLYAYSTLDRLSIMPIRVYGDIKHVYKECARVMRGMPNEQLFIDYCHLTLKNITCNVSHQKPTKTEGRVCEALEEGTRTRTWNDDSHTRYIVRALDGSMWASPPVALTKGTGVSPPAFAHFEGAYFEVVTGSTWQSNVRLTKSTTADCVLYKLHPRTRLPMSITLDGAGNHANHSDVVNIGARLGEEFTRILDLLEGSRFTADQVASYVKAVLMGLADECKNAESKATVGAVGVYTNSKGELRALAFNIGDVLLVHDNGEVIKSIINAREAVWSRYSMEIGDNVEERTTLQFPFPLGGCEMQMTIEGMQVVTLPVRPGDRILSMTDGAFENGALECSVNASGTVAVMANKAGNLPIKFKFVDRQITSQAFKAGESIQEIARKVQSRITKNYRDALGDVVGTDKEVTRGDDITIAAIKIPDGDPALLLPGFPTA